MAEYAIVSPRTVLSKKTDLIEAVMDDSVIILSLDKSQYYGGDEVAVDVWNLIDGVRDVQGIADALVGAYDAPVDAILADVSIFAREMIEAGLLESLK